MDYELQTIESSQNKEVLTQPAQKVIFPLNDDLLALVAHMKNRVVEIKGVGLAAPQINQPWQVVALHINQEAAAFRNDAKVLPVTILINPTYEPVKGTELKTDWEGCFSVENVTGKVPRYHQVFIKGQNEDGEQVAFEAEGFLARVYQHEIDHVHGMLIVDRLTEGTIHGHPKDMAKLRIQEMNPEQKAMMKTFIQEAIKNGKSKAYYESLLDLLEKDEA